jgi:hypothetical protein
MVFLLVFLLTSALTGCVTRQPLPQEIQSKRFETIADKAVVYLYRDRPDFADVVAGFTLDGDYRGASYRGTYYRIELAPGRHRIAGFAGDIGQLEFDAQAGRLYFIHHSVVRQRVTHQSRFQFVPDSLGRDAVLRYELNGAP